ncbi:translational machinery component [Pilatotrama ljubarskyi]|nr:translational machinery component [Pilatotrama ljubarskyi]
MSFLRVLPSLRSRAVQRAWAAPFSSSASTSARASGTQDIPNIIEALQDPAGTVAQYNEASSDSSAPPLDVVEDAPAEDGPPLPSEGSYPVNPVALANQEHRTGGIGTQKPVYAVSVKATRNNTIVTFARPGGNQLVTLTGGKLGFKKSNRNGYEAGYQCAVGIIAAMEEELKRTDFEWELFLKGFGQGRDAMLTAVTTAVGANVKGRLTRVTDRTPIKIGGTRGMKARRI